MRKKRAVLLVLIAVAVAVAASSLYVSAEVGKSARAHKGRILDNVRINDVAVGGMSRGEARAAVNAYIEKMPSASVNLTAGSKKKTVSAADLDIGHDVDGAVREAYGAGRNGSIFKRYFEIRRIGGEGLRVRLKTTASKEEISEILKRYRKHFAVKPRNAALKRVKRKGVIIKEVYGQKINVKKSADAVGRAVAEAWGRDENITVSLSVVRRIPKVTSEDLQGFTDVLGTYTTYYDPDEHSRCLNIARGTALINGTILKPGGGFSVYKAVAPFTAGNGYHLAGTIKGDEIKEDYGGGICQVSTTLYNAAIRAELKIRERHSHSLAISYVPLSADAAIAGTTSDLKLRNSRKAAVYLQGKTGRRHVTFTIYGKEDRAKNRRVIFESRTLAVNSPGTKVVEKDPDLAEGRKIIRAYGVTGYSAELWKVVKVDGRVKYRHRFNSSSYSSVPTKVIEGTKKAKAEKKKDKAGRKKK